MKREARIVKRREKERVYKERPKEGRAQQVLRLGWSTRAGRSRRRDSDREDTEGWKSTLEGL